MLFSCQSTSSAADIPYRTTLLLFSQIISENVRRAISSRILLKHSLYGTSLMSSSTNLLPTQDNHVKADISPAKYRPHLYTHLPLNLLIQKDLHKKA